MKELFPRRTTRKAAAAAMAAVAAVGLSVAVAAPAQAAVSAGASCKLSANWTVKFSVNYTAIGSNRQTTNYMVMNSPGTIATWKATIYQAGVVGPLWGPQTLVGPANLQRRNVSVTGTYLLVDMTVAGGNSSCSATVFLY